MDKIMTKIFKVDGMTCHSCEKTIEKTLNKIDGVIKVRANFTNSVMNIKYDTTKTNVKELELALEKEGYVLVTESSNKLVLISFIILLALYMMFQHSGLFNFIPDVNNNVSYGLLFVIGLLTSIHCIAMCGGINISVSMNNEHSYKPGIKYNLGRLVSYTVIGGLVGALGSTITFSNAAKDLVSIIAGIFMIIMGINMSGLFKRVRLFNIHMPKFLTNFIKDKKKKANSPFVIGLLNGFMPCGPLQTMQLYALGTGSLLKGALSMFIFSLGTLPLMIGLSSLSGFMSGKMGVKLKKISGLLVIFLGVIMFNRGFDYTIFMNLTKPNINLDNVAKAEIKDDYQEVTTRFENGRYKPIVVQKGIPVKWNIVIEDGDLNGCNNAIIINTYNLDQDLNYGDNLITFTPDEVGTFKYTCWMRMLASYIYVVEDIATIN